MVDPVKPRNDLDEDEALFDPTASLPQPIDDFDTPTVQTEIPTSAAPPPPPPRTPTSPPPPPAVARVRDDVVGTAPVAPVIRPALQTNPFGRPAVSMPSGPMAAAPAPPIVLPLPGQSMPRRFDGDPGPTVPVAAPPALRSSSQESAPLPEVTNPRGRSVASSEGRRSSSTTGEAIRAVSLDPLLPPPANRAVSLDPPMSGSATPSMESGRNRAFVALDPPMPPASESGRNRAVSLDPSLPPSASTSTPPTANPPSANRGRADESKPKTTQRWLMPAVVAVVVGAVGLIALDRAGSSRVWSVADKERFAEVWLADPNGAAAWGGREVAGAVSGEVDAIGNAVAAALGRKARFVVVADGVTAMAMPLPDGTVVISMGMLRRLTSEAQLAAILAHALAHLENGDVDRTIDAAPDVAAVRAALRGEGQSDVALKLAVTAGTQIYDRQHEDAADVVAVEALRKAGFDPQGMWLALRNLGGTRRSSWLLQHPDAVERMDKLHNVEGSGRVGDELYRRLITDRTGRIAPTTASSNPTTTPTPSTPATPSMPATPTP